MSSNASRNKRSQRQPSSIRFQLLFVVNLTLATAILGLLIYQYHYEMGGEVRKKHASLNDESIAIHAAVNHLSRNHHSDAVQSFINTVCDRMRATTSPCHHIVVKLRGQIFQAQNHSEEPPQFINAITEAAIVKNHQSIAGNHILVAGSHVADGISVFVSEDLADVRRAVRRDVLIQVGIIGVLGLVAAGIVNFVLLRVVDVPLSKLMQTLDQIASGQFGIEAPTFRSSEMQRLSTALNSMSQTLLKNEQEHQQQMMKAQQIQQHLLPNLVEIPGLQTADLFQPADVVAGDYYDFLALDDGSWLICLADVTGHGIPAALGAAMLKSLLLSACEEPPFDPVSPFREINRHFAKTVLPGNFASMFLARWIPDCQEFSWASAGHEPGILLSNSGSIDLLESTGLLLGVDIDAQWEHRTLRLLPGDRILLFSDGATETRNAHDELFGRERLKDCFWEASRRSLRQSIVELEQRLREFRYRELLDDDLTLVAFGVSREQTKKCDISSPEETSL